MTSLSSRVQLQRLLKNDQSTCPQQVPLRVTRPDSSYNLKDFLPNTSSISIQNRQKTKSIITPPVSLHTQNKSTHLTTTNNVEQKMIQQKMNRLKQQNVQLQKALQQQVTINKGQSEQILQLRNLVEKMRQQQQAKLDKLSMWSYKYHVEYTPKQRHKYSLAVQTEDLFTSKTQASGSLRAKDFEDIYRRLNSNQSTVQMGTKKLRKQNNSLKSTLNFTLNNPSNVQANSTLKLRRVNEDNISIFKMPKLQDFMQKQNKENIMFNNNMNFNINPMDIKLAKIQAEQKPIQQQCIEIYPVEEEYLDSIVGELLCDDDQ